jgi:uncharacterized protein (DUF4415 family)
MPKKKSASSPHEKRLQAKDAFTAIRTPKQRRELLRLAALPDSEIDLSDAPELASPPPEVSIGRFYRPIKQLISLRVDADVLAWYRGHGKRYQTMMNEVLRRPMQQAQHKAESIQKKKRT